MADQLAFDSNQNPCNFEYAKIYAKQNFIVSALTGKTTVGTEYIKADDIVLKNKGNQPAGNPQNHSPQGQIGRAHV